MAEKKQDITHGTTKQPRSNYRKAFWLAVGVICFFGVAIGAGALTIYHFESNEAKVDRKLSSVRKPNTTCGQVIKDIGDVDTDTVTSVKQKVEILESQQACFADQLMFDKAIAAAETLKQVYSSQNDSQNAVRMTNRISDLQAAKTEFSNQAKVNNNDSQ